MDELFYYQTIQNFMDNVKKDIFCKTNNLYNLRHSRDILNSLFNLFDYQITLMNQIVLFIKNNNQNYNYYVKSCSNINDYNKNSFQKENINHLININKDIMVSMIIKFLAKINSMLNLYKNKINKNNSNKLKIESKPKLYGISLISEKLLDSSYSNKNFVLKNSVFYEKKANNLKCNSSTYNKKVKDLNSSVSKTSRFNNNNDLFDYNCYNKNNKTFSKKKYNNLDKRIDKHKKGFKCQNLKTVINIDDNLKKKKRFLYKSNSTKNKNIIIDLNDTSLKNLFNLPLYYNSHIKTKSSKED